MALAKPARKLPNLRREATDFLAELGVFTSNFFHKIGGRRATDWAFAIQELDAGRVVLPPYRRAEKHASALRNFKLELGGKYEVLTDLKPGATQ